MNNSVVPFQVKEFPKKGIWRVHAFGEVRVNPQISDEPTVDLFIVPLKFMSDKGIDLNSSKSYDYSRLQSVQIGVGQISGICIGSLLCDQKRMYRLPSYTTIKVMFNTRVVSSAHVHAGDNYFDGEDDPNPTRILPDNYYLVPKELREMPCLGYQVQREDQTEDGKISLKWTNILIPCWVILQYYFGTSSRLIKALINGDLENGSNQIYDPDPSLTYHNEEDGFFYVRLRQKMFDADAQTIARIAADERITLIAKNIYNSMVANYNSGKGAFPEAHLPFFGDTEMELCGKNIKNDHEWFFLVYYIKSCSGTFPYDKLKYDRDNDGRKALINNPERKEAWNSPKRHTSKSKDKEGGQKITSTEPPCLNIIETEIVLPPRGFLSQPTDVRKLLKETANYRSAQAELICRTHGTKRDLSTGDGKNGGETARLGIKTDTERKLRKPRESASPDFDSMLKVLESIFHNNPSNFSYELITVLEDEEYERNGFSIFPSYQGGKRIAWSFIPGDFTRFRQVLVAEMLFKNKYFYLIEIERRVTESGEPKEHFNTFILHENLAYIEKLQFEKILLYLAKNKGVYAEDWEFPSITREKFKHGWKIESFVETLINYFSNEISKGKTHGDGLKKLQFENFIDREEVEKHDDFTRLVG